MKKGFLKFFQCCSKSNGLGNLEDSVHVHLKNPPKKAVNEIQRESFVPRNDLSFLVLSKNENGETGDAVVASF